MDFEPDPTHGPLRSTAEDVASSFGPDYWREREEAGEFATAFWDELAEAGFHGLLVPEEHGGAGMGMQEMGIAMETLCAEGCGMAGTWYLVLTACMAALGVRNHGTAAQRERYLPAIAAGDVVFSVGITEPGAGTNTPNITTRAERDGDGYVVAGEKVWITFADVADHLLLVARTTPREAIDRRTDGMSLLVVDMDDPGIEVEPIPKHGINYSNSCQVRLEDVRVPAANRLGGEGNGWPVLLDLLNPERVAFAAAATGIGTLAADAAIEYANDREVFGAPIGTHQAVAFPIAEAYARMEAARRMRLEAAWRYDRDEACGYETSVAKATAVEAGIDAVEHAMQAFGGWGYAKEYHVERWWREVNLTRLAPVTQQMAYNHVAREIGLPRSY